MKPKLRFERLAGVAALVLLILGCLVVLRPFVSALLWAAVLCYCTWPLYSRIERWLNGRRTIAAALMTGLIAVVLVVPFVVAGFGLADNVARLATELQALLEQGPPDPPAWIGRLPWIGPTLQAHWQEVAHQRERLWDLSQQYFGPARTWVLRRGIGLGQGILQLSLSVFVTFFFYRDGAAVADTIVAAGRRVIGDRTQQILTVAGDTVRGVVYGILGTALAQGFLAALGFWIAGVPGALLLGLLTFFLSLVPVGPPLVWIPATIWLFTKGATGWGVFLAIWGVVVISGIDNVIKPYLISRGSNLPFVLVFLGVLGGVIAFGFIGVFLGPTLLAVAFSLSQQWIAVRQPADP